MMSLSEQSCESYPPNAQRLDDDELHALVKELQGWQPIVKGDIIQLEREFNFPDFLQALDFVNSIGDLAEAECHHPAMTIEWGKVTINWWTHTVQGLHKNDFICAAKCNVIYTRSYGIKSVS